MATVHGQVRCSTGNVMLAHGQRHQVADEGARRREQSVPLMGSTTHPRSTPSCAFESGAPLGSPIPGAVKQSATSMSKATPLLLVPVPVLAISPPVAAAPSLDAPVPPASLQDEVVLHAVLGPLLDFAWLP